MGKLAGVIEALAILLVVFLAKVDGRDESEV